MDCRSSAWRRSTNASSVPPASSSSLSRIACSSSRIGFFVIAIVSAKELGGCTNQQMAESEFIKQSVKCGEAHGCWQYVCSLTSTSIVYRPRRLRQCEAHQQPLFAGSWMQTGAHGPRFGHRCRLAQLVDHPAISADPPQPLDRPPTFRRSQVATRPRRISDVRVTTTGELGAESLQSVRRYSATPRHD